MNYKSILFFLGIYSLLVSLFSVLNILYSIYFSFIIDLNSYLLTFLISLIIGSTFYYVGRNHSKDITLTDQIIFVVLSFILIPFFPIQHLSLKSSIINVSLFINLISITYLYMNKLYYHLLWTYRIRLDKRTKRWWTLMLI